MFTSLTGYQVRETEHAVAFVDGKTTVDAKILWLPKKKIDASLEMDTPSIAIQIKGEKISRSAIPYTFEVSTAFLQKIGVLPTEKQMAQALIAI